MPTVPTAVLTTTPPGVLEVRPPMKRIVPLAKLATTFAVPAAGS
jgi:hypothetical protein